MLMLTAIEMLNAKKITTTSILPRHNVKSQHSMSGAINVFEWTRMTKWKACVWDAWKLKEKKTTKSHKNKSNGK